MARINDLLSSGRENTLLVVTAEQLEEYSLSLLRKYAASTQSEEKEKWYSPDEFAKQQNVSKATLWRWAKAGIVLKRTVGGKVYYKENVK